MINPYVSIVSGTYNRLNHLKKMIDSVRKSVGLGIPYEIVIVDGGSTDGSLEWLRKQEDIVLIEQKELLGAVKAFNAGFKIAKGKYVVIANDDIEFLYESIQKSIAFMDDNPTCGIGCFHQNRYSQEYTIGLMHAVKDGQQTSTYYGQVCIVPKWIGDKVGWWGTKYHTYAGDNELSCNVLELGYQILPLEFCCINDHIVNDQLRIKNNVLDKDIGRHKDSETWVKKWTKNGLIGPTLGKSIQIKNPLKPMQRIVYAPLYEEIDFPAQLKTKFGLRKALAEKYLVSEVNYRRNIDNLYYTLLMFSPHICLIQYHDPKLLTYDFMMKAKDEFKNTLFFSWNGDYSEAMLHSKAYIQVAKLFDIASFVAADIAQDYIVQGIEYRYWQIGYEEYESLPDSKIEQDKYDIIFMGNCYHKVRQTMGELLRLRKEWKVGLFGKWPSHIRSNGITQYNFIGGDLLYRSSKIAIGDNLYPNAIGYISNRIFQSLHAGAFLLQQKFNGMEELLGLEDMKHLVIWEDLDDLIEKIKDWLPKNSERRQIAAEGKRFVDINHSFKVRVEEFEKIISDFKNGTSQKFQ